MTFLVIYQAMFYFVRTFKDFSKVKEKKKTQKLVCHKIKLQVTLNAKKKSSRSEGAHHFLPTPPSSVSCSRSDPRGAGRSAQAGCETAVRAHRRHCLLTASPAPPERKLRGLLMRAGNLDSPIAGPACVTPAGLRGHPARLHSKNGVTSSRD